MSDVKFYRCPVCGNIVTIVDEKAPVVPSCCGQPMELIVPGSVDAAAEKHVPVATVAHGHVTVKVGSAPHPMTEPHLIEWIAVATDKRFDLIHLTADDAPEALFGLGGATSGTAYAYCNLHGLWKADFEA